MSESAFRLSRAITPSHYRLKIAPDLDAATFDGTVSIDAETTEGTNSITIHAVDLTITSADTAAMGDTVTVTGTLAVDTDFGSGYKYPLLLEKATITQVP